MDIKICSILFYVTFGNFLHSFQLQTKMDLLFRRANATTVRIECMLSFVSFLFDLLPCTINASLSVFECVQFSLFPPSTKWWPLGCVSSLKLIAQTIRTHTHDGCKFVCVKREYRSLNCTLAHQYMSVCVCVTAKLLIVFLFFVRF